MSMLDIAKERFVSFETERAQAAALIALAEQMGIIAEHLGFIRSHMDDVSGVLLNAQGADGVIKVDTDGRR